MRPLAFGVAAVYFLRFPFRLALARFMVASARGDAAGVPSALGFALLHAPTALFYGAVATFGWILGSLVALPIVATLHAGLAFHRFAVGDASALGALREAMRIPSAGVGLKLIGSASVVYLGLFLITWTAPGSALGLAEWLFRADVAALQQLLGLASPAWLGVALILPLVAVELLFSLAFGLVSREWDRLSAAPDLLARLQLLEARLAAGEGFE
jgi:hypothetical protein